MAVEISARTERSTQSVEPEIDVLRQKNNSTTVCSLSVLCTTIGDAHCDPVLAYQESEGIAICELVVYRTTYPLQHDSNARATLRIRHFISYADIAKLGTSLQQL